MATETSSIDELLSTVANATTPVVSEQKGHHADSKKMNDVLDKVESGFDTETLGHPELSEAKEEPTPESDLEEVKTTPENSQDEYGNDIPPPKTYTEDEVNERINQRVRERLARLEKNAQPVQQQMPSQQQQQQAQNAGFEYNADSQETWQQQLESFVEQTVSKMHQKQAYQQSVQKEQRATMEFESKFQSGMSKFQDFQDVVASQPITDAMVIATRGMKDPAGFMYAAAKRAPAELDRISKIQDQYAQMVEMGKLEERMKSQKVATKAPKPLSKSKEDMAVDVKSKKEPTLDDLLAASDAKRKAQYNARRR